MRNRKLRALVRRVHHFLFYRDMGYGFAAAWKRAGLVI